MKVILLALFSIFCLNVFSQVAQTLTSLLYGNTLEVQDITIKIVKILEDSRCSKDVMCVRAGEAKVLVEVYKKGQFIRTNELVFDASGFVEVELMSLFESDDLSISGLSLQPYPTAVGEIKKEDYRLKVTVNIVE